MAGALRAVRASRQRPMACPVSGRTGKPRAMCSMPSNDLVDRGHSFGQDVTEIILRRWIATVGAQVESDEPIYELSTPAVDSGIPSPAAGIMVEVFVQEASTIVKGQILATILTDAPAN